MYTIKQILPCVYICSHIRTSVLSPAWFVFFVHIREVTVGMFLFVYLASVCEWLQVNALGIVIQESAPSKVLIIIIIIIMYKQALDYTHDPWSQGAATAHKEMSVLLNFVFTVLYHTFNCRLISLLFFVFFFSANLFCFLLFGGLFVVFCFSDAFLRSIGQHNFKYHDTLSYTVNGYAFTPSSHGVINTQKE